MILLDYLLIPAFVYVLIAVALETLLPGIDRGVLDRVARCGHDRRQLVSVSP